MSDQEIISLRTENSKTYKLANGGRRLVASMGAIHYKDNYADPNEPWKDIDLTWDGKRITKAPYELTVDGNKATFRDKKTGDVSTIELVDTSPSGLKWEIIPNNTGFNFRHTLPSDKIPFEARFKVSGKARIAGKSFDEQGEIELETSVKDGILTEKLSQIQDKETKELREAVGKVRIDPSVEGSMSSINDDADDYGADGSETIRQSNDNLNFYSNTTKDNAYKCMGCRWAVNIDQGVTIKDGTHASFYTGNSDYDDANGVIYGNDVDDANDFSTEADIRDRTRTTANVSWVQDGVWPSPPQWGNTPELKTIIQEIVDRPGWAANQHIALLFIANTDAVKYFIPRAYDYDDHSLAPKLVIEYGIPTTVSAPTATATSEGLAATISTGTGTTISGVSATSDGAGIAPTITAGTGATISAATATATARGLSFDVIIQGFRKLKSFAGKTLGSFKGRGLSSHSGKDRS